MVSFKNCCIRVAPSSLSCSSAKDPSTTGNLRPPDQKQNRLEEIREVLRTIETALSTAGNGSREVSLSLAGQLRQAQQALQEAEALIEGQPAVSSRAILETIVGAYIRLDKDWTFTELNAAAARMLDI